MKIVNAHKIALFAGFAFASAGVANAADCDTIGKQVSKAVADSPSIVLVVVDEMISKNEACACEIVKAAIDASSADKSLVREIVVTAVTAAQGMAATIAECAVAAAPEAAAEIKAGLSEVFAGAKSGEVYSAKGGYSAKEVVEEEDFGLGPAPIVVSGVYLIAPVAAGGGLSEDGLDALSDAARKAQQRLINILRRRARDGRDPDQSTTTSPPPSPTDGMPKMPK